MRWPHRARPTPRSRRCPPPPKRCSSSPLGLSPRPDIIRGVPARLAASAAACAGAWALPAYAPNLPWLAARLGIAMRTAHPGAIALTFDDGPHPEGTPAVLDALDRAGARATFFLVGERVERAPHVAREIVARGHAVAIHGYRHRSLMRLGPRAID